MSDLATQLGGKCYSGASALAISEAAAVVLGADNGIDVQPYDRYGFYIQNVGAQAITEVTVESAPMPGGPWVDLGDVTGGDGVDATSSAFFKLVDQTNKYIRVKAVCAAGEATTARFWLCVGGLS